MRESCMWSDTEVLHLHEYGQSEHRMIEGYGIFVLSSGKGEVQIGKHSWSAKSGSLLFVNPDRIIRVTSVSGATLTGYLVTFDIVRETETDGKRALYMDRQSEWLTDGPVAVKAIRRVEVIAKELAMNAAESSYRKQMKLGELLDLLPISYEDSKDKSEPGWLEAVIAYMKENYENKISREQLAQMSGFHPDYFSNQFKKETGLSYTEILTKIRIDKAKQYLFLGDRNLNEIAQRIGYSDGLYLSRKFKQVVGIPPSRYVHKPERIVVVELVGELLALGVKPIAASHSNSLGNLKLLQHELKDVIEIDNRLDQLRSFQPDLVIIPDCWGTAEIYRHLSSSVQIKVIPFDNPVRRLRELAETFNKQEEAESLLALYERKAKLIKEQLGDVIGPNETVGVYEIWQDEIWVFGNPSFGRGVFNLYETFGFNPPLAVKKAFTDTSLWYKNISIEDLPRYAADHMIVSVYDEDGGQAHFEHITSSPIWRQLEAYRNGRIRMIDMNVLHPGDLLSSVRQLDKIADALLNPAVGQ
ncbi:AraC family transcriptional regulator [Paenibacillus sp. GSMTC-2017]|uniref:AraC family transcriptional regulator n=1 Tax=Paenibacillus sp. GSMTC-2017 TaxID=2794350 RepID=UPI0018D73E0E|nr:AraC family transcriptional regulator [Paenibacillus sp. GSMTC-2017]MBH5318763.1 AraC family transcriptional regulator [Paenibacillus sp. GSMTC-2017]